MITDWTLVSGGSLAKGQSNYMAFWEKAKPRSGQEQVQISQKLRERVDIEGKRYLRVLSFFCRIL